MSDPLVSTAWLADHLGEVQVVDGTWHMPGEGIGRDTYEAGHIPGAVFFDIDEVADTSSGLPHMLPSPDAFAQMAGQLGLQRDRAVVVYDAHGIFSAPRVWWSLRTMGFAQVHVLDGGLKKWRAEGRPVVTGSRVPTSTVVDCAFVPGLVRDRHAVADLLERREAQLVDARPGPRFRGEAPEPRPGVRSGHMPGAHNVPSGGLVNADGTLKSAAELQAAFETAGVDMTRPIVTTCGSGVTAALLALALARLGREDVAVYDGSWTEWGGRADTAVVTGA